MTRFMVIEKDRLGKIVTRVFGSRVPLEPKGTEVVGDTLQFLTQGISLCYRPQAVY